MSSCPGIGAAVSVVSVSLMAVENDTPDNQLQESNLNWNFSYFQAQRLR
jgi:hypothetical protein